MAGFYSAVDSTSDLFANGNTLANVIIGNAGDNTFRGADGNDSISGMAEWRATRTAA